MANAKAYAKKIGLVEPNLPKLIKTQKRPTLLELAVLICARYKSEFVS